MGQHKYKLPHSNAPLPIQMQNNTSEVVKYERWLVENKFAEWKIIDEFDIGFVFYGNFFEMDGDRLKVKNRFIPAFPTGEG